MMTDNPFQSPDSDFQKVEETANPVDLESRKKNMALESLTRAIGCFYLFLAGFGILSVAIIIHGYQDPYLVSNKKQYMLPVSGIVALISLFFLVLGIGLMCLNRISYYIAIPVFLTLPFVSWLLFPTNVTWITGVIVTLLIAYMLSPSIKFLYSDEYWRIVKVTK